MEANIHPKPRRLKVTEVGDFWKRRTRPQIRLEGRWLARAGIIPNQHVSIENPLPGVLVIRMLEKSGEE